MTDNNQAYTKKCPDCGLIADKLFLTKVSFDQSKKVYRMLCSKCTQRYVR